MRIFFVHHVTWSVNSVCHFLGSRRFDTDDRSTNVFWLAAPLARRVLAPQPPRLPPLRRPRPQRWELDPSAVIIAAMEKLGLARNVIRISTRAPGSERAAVDIAAPASVSGQSGKSL